MSFFACFSVCLAERVLTGHKKARRQALRCCSNSASKMSTDKALLTPFPFCHVSTFFLPITPIIVGLFVVGRRLTLRVGSATLPHSLAHSMTQCRQIRRGVQARDCPSKRLSKQEETKMVEIERCQRCRNRRAVIALPSIATLVASGAAGLIPGTATAFQVHRFQLHSPPIGSSKRKWQTATTRRSTSSLHIISPTAEELVESARQSLAQNDTDAAFAQLAQAHETNANVPGLFAAFEDVFRARISLYNDPLDRLGLGSLLLEREKYSEAAIEFKAVLDDATLTDETSRERAASSLFRCKANVCDWSGYDDDCAALVATVRSSLEANQLPTVHPYEALMWPCLSVSDAARIGAQYGARALASVNKALPLPDLSPRASRYKETGKVRIGYLSNDFTGRHPLGFLMQDVFRFHSNGFEVYIYSLMHYDGSPEVEKIRAASASGGWRELLGSPYDSAETIRGVNLDILVDLTIYNGPANEAEILAYRVAPIQISHGAFLRPVDVHLSSITSCVIKSLFRSTCSSTILSGNCICQTVSLSIRIVISQQTE